MENEIQVKFGHLTSEFLSECFSVDWCVEYSPVLENELAALQRVFLLLANSVYSSMYMVVVLR